MGELVHTTGSKAFTTHVRTGTRAFGHRQQFLLPQNPTVQGTKELNRNGAREVFPPQPYPPFNSTSCWCRRRENPEVSGQASGDFICFSSAMLAWPCCGETSRAKAEPRLGGLLPGLCLQLKPHELLLEARTGWELFRETICLQKMLIY